MEAGDRGGRGGVMSPTAKFVFGILPAIFLLPIIAIGAGFIGPVLVLTALLGMCGLIWSFVGYSRKTAPLVLLLLSIGVFAVLGALANVRLASIPVLFRNALNNPLEPLPILVFRLLLTSWLLLGPLVVGLIQANGAVRVLRKRPPE